MRIPVWQSRHCPYNTPFTMNIITFPDSPFILHQPFEPAGELLLDYLPPNALMFIDESHVTIPQIGGMYKGDRAQRELGQHMLWAKCNA